MRIVALLGCGLLALGGCSGEAPVEARVGGSSDTIPGGVGEVDAEQAAWRLASLRHRPCSRFRILDEVRSCLGGRGLLDASTAVRLLTTAHAAWSSADRDWVDSAVLAVVEADGLTSAVVDALGDRPADALSSRVAEWRTLWAPSLSAAVAAARVPRDLVAWINRRAAESTAVDSDDLVRLVAGASEPSASSAEVEVALCVRAAQHRRRRSESTGADELRDLVVRWTVWTGEDGFEGSGPRLPAACLVAASDVLDHVPDAAERAARLRRLFRLVPMATGSAGDWRELIQRVGRWFADPDLGADALAASAAAGLREDAVGWSAEELHRMSSGDESLLAAALARVRGDGGIVYLLRLAERDAAHTHAMGSATPWMDRLSSELALRIGKQTAGPPNPTWFMHCAEASRHRIRIEDVTWPAECLRGPLLTIAARAYFDLCATCTVDASGEVRRLLEDRPILQRMYDDRRLLEDLLLVMSPLEGHGSEGDLRARLGDRKLQRPGFGPLACVFMSRLENLGSMAVRRASEALLRFASGHPDADARRKAAWLVVAASDDDQHLAAAMSRLTARRDVVALEGAWAAVRDAVRFRRPFSPAAVADHWRATRSVDEGGAATAELQSRWVELLDVCPTSFRQQLEMRLGVDPAPSGSAQRNDSGQHAEVEGR